MSLNKSHYQKIKKKYLKFLKTQEVLTEPFRDKVGQLNKFYLPLSKMISDEFLKNKKSNWSYWRTRVGEINYFKHFKNYIKRRISFRNCYIFNR